MSIFGKFSVLLEKVRGPMMASNRRSARQMPVS